MLQEAELDRIERKITIASTQERVWRLVTEPGWWINNGTITEHDIAAEGKYRFIITDPVHGQFAIILIDQKPQDYVAFQWYSGPSDTARVGPLDESTSTLVEFFLTASQAETTTLRVVESGFSRLSEDAHHRRMMFEDNKEGWQLELAAARDHLEGAIA